MRVRLGIEDVAELPPLPPFAPSPLLPKEDDADDDGGSASSESEMEMDFSPPARGPLSRRRSPLGSAACSPFGKGVYRCRKTGCMADGRSRS